MEILLVIIAAGLGMAAMMAISWVVQQRTGNSGWIDTFWTFSTGLAAFTLALMPIDDFPAALSRQLIAATFAAIWSLRLGLHILLRTRAGTDDPRYRDMIGQWGGQAKSRLFWHLQVQAFFGLLLALCVMLAARNPAPDLRLQDFAAICWFAASAIGEGVADWQLRKFKQNTANRGGVCDVGLWRYSRHPNYFCEWLCWLAYPLLAISFNGNYLIGFAAVLAPICIYWLLAHVSGIPPLEAHMVRSRPALFKDYQRRTSAFFPRRPAP
jgi:steroid 5-alpha reductase family enzyme